MRPCPLLASVGLFISLAWSSERKFDVKDDIFAYPQYDVVFPPSYVFRQDAEAKLAASLSAESSDEQYTYEYMVGNQRPYLCAIPRVKLSSTSDPEEDAGIQSQTDIVAAADRGGQLLSDMEGQQCLYYRTGWWTYAFCYNDYVKQYHAIQTPPHSSQWPPPEDPGVESYYLGKHHTKVDPKADTNVQVKDKPKPGDSGASNSLSLQTTQEQNAYLTQTFGHGSPCDLTGTPRTIEVQYHCSPGTPDRIGWIKETATCTYQMVVYTSRLCSDVAFQPPKEAKVYEVACEQILDGESEVAAWRQFRAGHIDPEIRTGFEGDVQATLLDNLDEQQFPKVGKIQVGSRSILGPHAKPLQKGRIVMTAAELALLDNSAGSSQQTQIVVVSKNGKLQTLGRDDLKKLDLNPAEVEEFIKEMQKFADGKDFKIERKVKKKAGPGQDGVVELMGVVDDDDDDDDDKAAAADSKDEEEGSEEEFKQEL